jgi:precorrin-2/cobalt-factor-2 C20-methyltransferase
MPYLYPTSVRKTSVYLPENLKDELTGLARRWERSEAELLRLAVERLIQAARADTAPGARTRVRQPGPRLVGVGVGPSDPELITERAVATVRDADRVFAASTAPDAIGRAEAVVRTAAPEVQVDRLVLDIAGDPAARSASLAAAATTVVETLDTGSVVAFVTLGDPNVYSTFPALGAIVADLRPSVPITTVPGVMAFQELAAETGTVLAQDGEYLTLAVAGVDPTPLDGLLTDAHHTVVVYKGGRHLPAVATSLRDRDRLEGAVMGEMIGLPGGRCVPVATVADRPASYLATVVIPAIRGSRR